MAERLIIIGDSYCAGRGPASWVSMLRDDYKVYASGVGGTGWWTHWQNYRNVKNYILKKEGALNKSNTSIVWIHSSCYRLPNTINLPITPAVGVVKSGRQEHAGVNKLDPSHTQLLDDAFVFYNSNLFDPNFYEFTELAWWSELSMMLKSYKKVVHLFGIQNVHFDYNVHRLLTDNSMVVNTPLVNLSNAELPVFNGGTGDGENGVFDQRENHFNEHNNRELSKFILDLLENGTTNIRYDIDYSTWDLVDLTKLEPVNNFGSITKLKNLILTNKD